MRGVGIGVGCFLAGLAIGYAIGRMGPAPGAAEGLPEPAPSLADAGAPPLDELDDLSDLLDLDAGGPDVGPHDAGPRWETRETRDEMRGTTTRLACIEASSPLNLSFPYAEAEAGFCFRDSPEHGHDAFFRVTEGQILCGFDGCRVSVRFDDGPVEELRALGGASSSEVLFMRDADGFARRALRASRFVIEVEFYGNGRRQVEFENAGGLVWEIPR